MIVDDTNHGPADKFGSIDLSPGTHTLEYVMWERGGGATAELFAAPGTKLSFDSSFTLIGDPFGHLPFRTLGTGLATDIESTMHEVNASAYLRYPFEVAQPGSLRTLTLEVEHDDGQHETRHGDRVRHVHHRARGIAVGRCAHEAGSGPAVFL